MFVALVLAAATTFDVVTYAPPAGFDVSSGRSVTFTRAGADPCEIDLFASVTRTGELEAVFRREWKSKAGAGAAPAAPPTATTLGSGLPSLVGIAQGAGGITLLTVVDGGTRATSVRMLAPTAEAMTTCQAPYAALLRSISFAGAAPSAAAATPAVAAQAAPPAAATGGAPTLGPVPPTLRISDLAGRWVPRNPVAFQTAYYSRSTGAFTSSDTTVSLESWIFDSSGHFTFRQSGLSHGSSYDLTDTGNADVTDGMLTLHGNPNTRRYRLLGYEDRADGTFLRILPDFANPSKQVDLDTYAQYLVRTK